MFNRKGFTLIELLIVVVIIGILAAIAIPKFAATKDKAKLSSVQTDLRNIVTAQEAYFADWATYGSLANLLSTNMVNLSIGNTGTVTGGASGWTASMYNTTITSGKGTSGSPCSVGVGASAASTTQDGKITC